LPEGADPALADYLLTALNSPARIEKLIPRRKPDIRVLMECAREGKRLGVEAWEISVPDGYRPERSLVEAEARVRSWVG
jgi:hypothetical protein